MCLAMYVGLIWTMACSNPSSTAGPTPPATQAAHEDVAPQPVSIGGVVLGSTVDQATALLGAPGSTEEKEGITTLTYENVEFPWASLTLHGAAKLAFDERGLRTGIARADLGMEPSAAIEDFEASWRGYEREVYLVASWTASANRRYSRPLPEVLATGGVTLGGWLQESEGKAAWMLGADLDSKLMQALLLVREDVFQSERPADVALADLFRAFDAYPTGPKVQKAFTLGEFSVTVDSITATQSVGTGPLARAAHPTASYVVVQYTEVNEGQETATGLAGNVQLLDQKDRRFTPSAEATTTMAMETGTDLTISQWQPGIPRRQLAVFEVPTSTLNHLRLVVPEKGTLSTGQAVMRLNLEDQP